jgi:hypothetical protein
MRELRWTLLNTPGLWVTAETANAVLKDMSPRTREWLQKHYSLTDLKRLLRQNLLAASRSVPASSANVRFASWVLTSLPFWAAIDDPLDESAIGRELARMSTAHVRPDTADIPPPVRLALQRGVDALLSDDPVVAVAEFERAIKLDRGTAITGFNVVWAARLLQVFTRDLTRRYTSLDDLRMDQLERIDLDDMSRRAREVGDRGAQWQLAVYKLAADKAAEDADAQKQDDQLRALLSQAGESDRNPEQARWLSLEFLRRYDPLRADAADAKALNDASALFKSGVRRMDESASLNAFAEIAALVQTNGNWAWPLVDDVVDTARRDGAELIVLELAWRLANEERKDRLQRSLALIDDFQRMTSTRAVSPAKRAQQAEQIQYVRTMALLGLERLGLVEAADVEPLLRALQQSPGDDIQKAASSELAKLLLDRERYSEGQAIAAAAREKWPDFPDPVGALLKARLRRGDTPGVIAITRLAAQKSTTAKNEEERTGWLYLETVGSILTKQPRWESVVDRFLAVKHDYHDYIRMMAFSYGRDGSSQAAALQQRLAQLNPSTWPGRLRNGELSAWREMLLGRFNDVGASDAIFTTLTNDAAFETSAFAQLPMAQIGQQCEAWFYEAMLAKARGQKEQMLEYLRRSIATGFTAYWEYAMASYLLAHPD